MQLIKNIFFTITLVLISGFVLSTKAQDPIVISQYYLYGPVINPAFTGIDEFSQFQLGTRNHWSGIDENISTNILSYQVGLKKKLPDTFKEYSLRISDPTLYDSLFKANYKGAKKLNHGLGGYVIYDKFGPYSQFQAKANYAMHIALSENIRLSIGGNVGIINERLDLDEINLRNPNDDYYQSLLAAGGQNLNINADAGISLSAENWYIGYAYKNLVNASIEENITRSSFTGKLHHINAGFQSKLGSSLYLIPSFMYVLDSENNSRWDANLRMRYKNQFWAGASYRNSKNMILMFGLFLGDKFNINYSYDFNTTYPNVFSKTHEIGLGLMLFKKKNEIPYFL